MSLDTVTVILSLALVTITTLYLYKTYGAKRRRYVTLINKIPGPPTIPFLGNALEELVPRNCIMNVVNKRHEEYAPIYRSWVGSDAEVHLTRPEHIEIILSSSKLIEKSWSYRYLYPWLGLGLLTSTGAKWHSRRKLITPTFHFKILEPFCDIFVENSEIMVQKLTEEAKLHGQSGFDVYPFITRCALDIICQTAMGTNVRAQEETHSEYVRAITEISESIIQRAIRPWLQADFIYNKTDRGRRYNHCLNVLHGFTTKVIQERRAEFLKTFKEKQNKTEEEDTFPGVKKRRAFLDLLLEASQEDSQLTDTEIREEVDTFMFEGHDTTAAGASWALFLLGVNPHIQDKVIAELDEIFQDPYRSITMRDLQDMKYLERVIKESLRLYPTVPFIGRNLTEDTQCGQYLIPAGCSINIHIYHVHRNSDYFPEPEVFNPDHFLPEHVQGRHPYAYIPFSAGPRNCIGQKFAMLEEKTMIAALLRKFRLQAVEKREDLVMISEVILRPESGIKLVLTPR